MISEHALMVHFLEGQNLNSKIYKDIDSSRKCSNLGQLDSGGKKIKILILKKSSGKLHFSLKIQSIFSNVSGWPRIAAFPTTVIAKN